MFPCLIYVPDCARFSEKLRLAEDESQLPQGRAFIILKVEATAADRELVVAAVKSIFHFS